MKSSRGLFQKVPGGTWYVRRAVPKDLWHVWKRERVASTQTLDSRQAERRRDDLWRLWDAEFAAARAGLGSVDLPQVLRAIAEWRRLACEAAVRGIVQDRVSEPIMINASAWAALRGSGKPSGAGAGGMLDVSSILQGGERDPVVDGDALTVSQTYYAAHPSASRELGTPISVSFLIGRLQLAARDQDGWMAISHFEDRLIEAVCAGGCEGTIPEHVIKQARQPFSEAWLEVEQHREWERQRAARYLGAVEAGSVPTGSFVVKSAPAFQPREDDRSIRELIAAYKAERYGKHGRIDTEKKYRHIFRALEEALGPDRPIRSVDGEAATAVRDLLRRLPVHASKRYPGLSLIEAADRASEDEAALLAPNSVRHYVVNLSAIFNFALKQKRWIETNPVVGLIDQRIDMVKRRGFTPQELSLIFERLREFKATGDARFWVPAISLYQGAPRGGGVSGETGGHQVCR